MKTTVYNKLVRDNIPQIIIKNGKTPKCTILTDSDYLKMLDIKLDEEVKEYHESGDAEELADLLEVIYAAAAARGYSEEQLNCIRKAKTEKNGTFNEKILLIEVTGD